jgi:DNA recombination protein RmuC
MSEFIVIALACLAAGLGGGAVLVLALRPRAAVPDNTAEIAFANLNTRLNDMAAWLNRSQGQLQENVNQRLDAVTARLGDTLTSTTKHTTDHLQKLHERLAVIDGAQKNITDLAGTVTSLQQVLSNKQARGALGQRQLEELIADVLPKGSYAFQHRLSNGKMPDCAIFMPDKSALIVDAKFPLEGIAEYRNAATDDERKHAYARVRADLNKHIGDIAERYMIPGETQEVAVMFIPSESLCAELHERFEDVVQRADRARVMIVSPSLLLMAVQVIKQLRKDAQMRDAVELIRRETGLMMKDVGLLAERANKLKSHFGQASKDIDDILTSSGRIEKRADKIEGLEFDDTAAAILPGPAPRIDAAE